MKILRQIIGIENLYYTYSLMSVPTAFFVVFIVSQLFFSQLNSRLVGLYEDYPATVGIVLGVVLLVIAREILQTIYVRWVLWRSKKKHAMPIKTTSIENSTIVEAAKDGYIKQRVVGIESQDNWKMYFLDIDHCYKTKHGSLVAYKKLTHTVFEIQLSRTVPNVVFDNKKASGRQFNSVFLNSQKINLEGNVKLAYEIYSPKTYHIDALSFISPEVLEAIMKLGRVDLEFIDDRLLCYAPLLTKSQIAGYRDKCLDVFTAVNNNLDTYRDDRLSGVDRKTDITPFAKKLLKNPYRYLWQTIALVVAVALLIIYSVLFSDDALFLDRLLNVIYYPIILIIASIIYTVQAKNKNRKILREFEAKK
jgi:hypothetical protein